MMCGGTVYFVHDRQLSAPPFSSANNVTIWPSSFTPGQGSRDTHMQMQIHVRTALMWQARLLTTQLPATTSL